MMTYTFFFLFSVQYCSVDEDDLMHLLLCRVLTENTDPINYGSSQFHSNSDEFDSEVDGISSLRKYTIWSANINTHILPEYVVTFTAPPCLMGSNSSSRHGLRVKRQPKSPWMPLQPLISALSKILPPRAINVIKKHHKDLKVCNVISNCVINIDLIRVFFCFLVLVN